MTGAVTVAKLPQHRVFIGLGSNLGDRLRYLQDAAREIAHIPATSLRRAAGVYETRPWGNADQPPFLNTVIELYTAMGPAILLQRLQAVELQLGRQRKQSLAGQALTGDCRLRWGPRRIDCDILLYNQQEVRRPGLQIPHPRLASRAFVLVPLAELEPQALVPGCGPVAELLEQLPAEEREGVHLYGRLF